jgi:hypothetical protein
VYACSNTTLREANRSICGVRDRLPRAEPVAAFDELCAVSAFDAGGAVDAFRAATGPGRATFPLEVATAGSAECSRPYAPTTELPNVSLMIKMNCFT